MPRKILVLAGTAEARDLASIIHASGNTVVSSFAGVTQNPKLPDGEIRTGGFGGVEGLISYLREASITQMVDATHPFAAQMSRQAFAAAVAVQLPLLRLERPAWQSQEGDIWTHVTNMEEAADAIPPNARVLVTTGHKELPEIFLRTDLKGVVRLIEAPRLTVPHGWKVLLDRPPYTLPGELAVLREHRLTHLITKNAGGDATRAKLDAAREMGLNVAMIDRPKKAPARTVANVQAALSALGIEAGTG